ncbi:auxin transport protein (BIG) [Wolffia australiana]
MAAMAVGGGQEAELQQKSMATISQMLQILREEEVPSRLMARFRSESVQKGLRELLFILKSGIKKIGEDERLGVESWSREQIDCTLKVVRTIAAACFSVPVDRAEPVVIAILGDSIELCTCLLEKSSLQSDDISFQISLIELLEIMVVDGKFRNHEACKNSEDISLESLPFLPNGLDSMELDSFLGCNPQDIGVGFESQSSADRVLKVLTTDVFPGFSAHSSQRLSTSTLCLLRQWAVTHVKCLPRLLRILKDLFSKSNIQSEDVIFHLNLSMSSRVLNFLVNLAKDFPLVEGLGADLLITVTAITDSLPKLFKQEAEISECETSSAQNTLWGLLLIVLEDFLHFVRVVSCNSVVYQNVRAIMIANILNVLDSSVWRCDFSGSSIRCPVAYFPQIVMHLLKLIGEAKNQRLQSLDPNEFDFKSQRFSCHVDSEKVFLLRSFTVEEHLMLMFPSSRQWVDNLLHLAYFLHAEGARSRIKRNNIFQACTKSNVSEPESTASHEDDAIFGNLFSEASRPVGSSDGGDQLSVVVAGVSSGLHMPFVTAACELLNFLKTCIFSPDWDFSIFSEACRQLNENHIEYLLSLLLFQSYPDDKSSPISSGFLSQGTLPHANEICLRLLNNLLEHNVLSPFIEECLVDKILTVSGRKYVYNDHTLSLLARCFISSSSSRSTGKRLAGRVYESYCKYITERTNDIFSGCSDLTELSGTLPSIFHIEILLMAFHLANEAEKSSLVKIVFFSLREISRSLEESTSNQLSCWALLVSRLILVLRYLILHPGGCPSWLLLRLRWRLGAVYSSKSCFSLNFPESYSSWAPIEVGNILGDHIHELSVVNAVLPHLIDVAAFSFPASLSSISDGFQSLGIDYSDLVLSFSSILALWSGRKAETVEDMLLERYVFLLCWDTCMWVASLGGYVQWRENAESKDLSTPEYLINFSNLLLNHCSVTEEIIKVLPQLQSTQRQATFKGWEFLRNESLLSLVLYLLNAGVWAHSVREKSCKTDLWTEYNSKDREFLNAAEGTVISLTELDKIGWLLRILSSCLRQKLEILQEAFLSVLHGGQYNGDGFSSSLLIKHVLANGLVQSDLLDKCCGSKTSQLNSMVSLLAKLDEISALQISWLPSRILQRCMLHGFPSHSNVHSGLLLSCVLTVRDIVCAIDGFLRMGSAISSYLDGDLIDEIMGSVMVVKSDIIFVSIHEKCVSIFHSVSERLSGGFDYLCLYELKHLLGTLSESNCEDAIDAALLETLTVATLEKAEGLRLDKTRANIFKYFMGTVHAADNEVEQPFTGHGITYLALFTALEKCSSETVNLKVLQFFINILACSSLYPGFKQSLQKMFLALELSNLSVWLEKRLLGCAEESSGMVISKESSSELREVTMNFLSCLVSQPEEVMSREIRNRFVEAMLLSLERAFTLHDINTAKAFFTLVVQFLEGESSSKMFLERILLLIEVLAERQDLLQHMKFLFSFLGTVLGDPEVSKNTTNKLSDMHSSSCTLGVNPSIPRPIGRKNADALASRSQETESANMECDATSGDEDEDDGLSDGELAGINKEEEDDGNIESALASQLCTFTSSGNKFMEQHWYFCYTCDLTVSKGCCSVCAKVCHRGHRVVYSRSSRFFCDCGAGGVRGSNCQCLKPRKTAAGSNSAVRTSSGFKPLLPFSEDGDQAPDSDSDLDADALTDTDSSVKFSIPGEMIGILPTLLKDIDTEKHVLGLCGKLARAVAKKRENDLCKDKKVVLSRNMTLSCSTDVFQLKKTFKSGSFDLKVKADYANSRDLKSHLASGLLVKSLLSASTRGRLAVGEGDKVTIFDSSQLIGQGSLPMVTADKSSVKALSKNTVRFEIVHLLFNPIAENYLAVAGYEECQVLTLNSRGEVTDRLAVELALQHTYIFRVEWVPGSQVHLMVVTNVFVKIYNLSQDTISPIHYFTLKNDVIMDATLVLLSMGRLCLLVLSKCGSLFRLELSMEGDGGEKSLTQVISVDSGDLRPKGRSLYFSSSHRLLFLSYQDDITLVGRLDAAATTLTEVSKIYEEEDKPAGLHHWRDLFVEDGIFVCFSSVRSNAPLAVSFRQSELMAQNMRYLSGPVLPSVGIAAYKSIAKDKSYCLVFQDDGSLQIYSNAPETPDMSASLNLEKAKKIGAGILNSEVLSGMNTDFPLDFFEKTTCVTSDVRLSGDAIRSGDSEAAKQRLQSEDGFLESSSPSGFKISVSNLNPDVTMVGIRVQVGNTSVNHIPSEIAVFQRVIKLDEGMRAWYDIPFTTSESLISDEEFTVSIGPTFDGISLPRVDSLEVYSQPKDEFGWKQKMEAVLKFETNALGNNMPSLQKKYQNVQPASVQEQVLAEALNLLSRLYSACRSWNCLDLDEMADLDLGKVKCRDLLETVFQNEDKQLLLAAASRVLKAIISRKETYYHVKDTMRLLGVISTLPKLKSRIGVGSVSAGRVVKDFISLLRSVSRIAFHRQSNLVSFLESHGSEVVDGLMDVLWGILDLEKPDTETINSIVIPSVDLIYCYAECLTLHGKAAPGCSVASAVVLIKKLLFAPYEAVRTASSLALSSRLLQVPFPKQMILSPMDDTPDNPSAAKMSSDASTGTGGNAHVLPEDDGNLSSVQYCCDGCSTVPILRRRWHCNICPDFDLCETCYELLDSHQLPPPHSRDHPMSIIHIESDHHMFTGDELADGSLNLTATDISSQNLAAPIHVLESNMSGDDFPTQNQQRFVSISASNRAVNSLLLQQLIAEIKGWMRVTSGLAGIPIMQLFYRLFSVVSGPFMDSSKPESLDLEKVVKWFLEEIDLEKPFVTKECTSFGEIMILVFMFFTLMLRNWHQPGTESTNTKTGETQQEKGPSLSSSFLSRSSDDLEKNEFTSQLTRACSSLRQQSFVNYLMDILLQLVSEFKSSPGNNVENSHGLLTIRKDLPAGNFLPFFSDSYAKVHKTNLFLDYHRLLLENTFRVVYGLIRPEKHDKSVSREKTHHQRNSGTKELKLDGYQDVLCYYICNPNTAFVRRYARRLLLHLCGSKTQYYQVRDSWQFSNEVRELYKLKNESGGFQGPLLYEGSAKLVKSLSSLSEVAGARPRHWQKFCIKNGEILPLLADAVFCFGEESVILTLKLLTLAFYTGKDASSSSAVKTEGDDGTKFQSSSIDSKKKTKGDEVGSETSSDRSYLDMEQSVNIFYTREGGNVLLQRFIDTFLLDWNSTSLRSEAKAVLSGLWHHGKETFQETLLSVLLDKVKILPMYGQNTVEFIELLISLLGRPNGSKFSIVNKCLTADVINCIFETLHSQNELLANHPNSRLYSALIGFVEFDGYYLESDPCIACSCPEAPYTRMKLETLKSETKFTDNRIIVKCTGSHTIQSVAMNVHDARKSRSVKVLNLHYNNNPLADLSVLKNNWALWKRAKSCHLGVNQTELKVEFPIPISACNFMIELDSFYENLQASSLESLQCPRCSRAVTDKHGICSHCHENAYQCRQCRNINYENLNSFLCNECGYSKYGRFEFHFMAKPSFAFDEIGSDEEMRKVLAAIESESENAHRRYQQLLGFKKPLLKLTSSVGEQEADSSQHALKDTMQQMIASLPGPSCKINRKIALLGVLYGEKCKAAFDSVSKSVQMLQGLRRVLMSYLNKKKGISSQNPAVSRLPNNCYGCAATFTAHCMELLQVLSKNSTCRKQLVRLGILPELFENNIHQGPKTARSQARAVLCAFSEGDADAVAELNSLIQKKVMYCLEHHRSMDISQATREELLLLSETCSLVDEFWEARLRVAFKLLFSSIKYGAKHPAISEHVILPSLRIVSQACTPPKTDDIPDKQEGGRAIVKDDRGSGNSDLGVPLLSYSEWERGASYLDFVRRQSRFSKRSVSRDTLALKYALRWKRAACRRGGKSEFSSFELGSWVSELILSACSQSIRVEVCSLFALICPENSSRQFQLLNLLMNLLPASLAIGDSAAEYFDLFFKMIGSEASRLFLTARGCLAIVCRLITEEVNRIESQERRLNVDISQGFVLHKLVELLSKFLEVPTIRVRFMRAELISQVLEALLVLRGLILQKTKLISDCNRLLKELIDGLLESSENKRLFIRACISALELHFREPKAQTSLFILEQLRNVICPTKPEPVYLLYLYKAHTQEEFIRGSMTKKPYSSKEIGPLMRDVKNKICNQLDLIGLLDDDYGMELLVAGSIISLDLTIAQVYEQVWKKSCALTQSTASGSALLSSALPSGGELPPMAITYRLQGLDGEATEPMIKELEEDREESQDPEVEFAIAGAVRECGGLEVILGMIQRLSKQGLKSSEEELMALLNLLTYCCKIRENRRALLRKGALGLLLETARRAFSADVMEPAEGVLLIVEALSMEANDSNLSVTFQATTAATSADEEAKKIVLMFLERLSHKRHRNREMVARILPYLTYGEPAAMEALLQYFVPHLLDWPAFDRLEDSKEEEEEQRTAVENFVRLTESLRTSSGGERLKDMIVDKGIVASAVKHLLESFPQLAGEGLRLLSTPAILAVLRGVCRGHRRAQEEIAASSSLLPLLHSLERIPGGVEVAARAENLLDTLADEDGFLGDPVRRLRLATRDELRRRALLKRQQLLQGLGMRQEVGKIVVMARPSIMEEMEEEEEEGLACMVCREGYSLRPGDALGAYTYTKRVSLGGAARTGGDLVYTTVSHFNVIHFQCHLEAKRADAALKNPKKEWEGAALRNNETLCNSIFPLRGPALLPAQYARYIDQHWDNLAALGAADGSRIRLLSYDIVLMLARFATGASFSADSRGGGKESNARFLPFMVQMAAHLLDQPGPAGPPPQTRRSLARSVAAYLSSSPPSDEESVQFMMVTSLLAESYRDWRRHRLPFLRRGLRHAAAQHRLPHADESVLFPLLKPILVYLALIDRLQRFFKLPLAAAAAVATEEQDEENWERTMQARLGNVNEMVGLSKELLPWLEEMASVEDLQAVLSAVGMHSDVLAAGYPHCLAFILDAISPQPL